jgi:hypothetical protein
METPEHLLPEFLALHKIGRDWFTVTSYYEPQAEIKHIQLAMFPTLTASED